ncbi:MAG: tetratricopeptide repeat protein [Nitrospirae bacterium]|nr:tetratricopeptide repeat protein [Nitrospirota bacterium]
MPKTWKYDLDIAKYARQIEEDPANFRAYKERGNAYFRKRDFERAIADYNRAIELKPDYFLAYNNRGNVYMQTTRYEFAIADYDRAIELKPENGMPYNNRGFAFLLMGDLIRAEADIRKSLDLNPANIYALNSMAEICAAKGDASGSCKWLRMAIEKGYNNWSYIMTSPTYDAVRASDCFIEIMRDRRPPGVPPARQRHTTRRPGH